MINTLLYHGTTSRHLSRILSQGIEPRGKRRKGNWDSFPSHPDLVYLTTAYAPYFAWHAARKGEKAMIVEVDGSRIADSCLFPDEDFVSQCVSKTERRPLSEVHPKIRDTIFYYGDLAAASIEHLGNVAHRGAVDPAAITRLATIDLEKRRDLAWACMDPSISLVNYKFCGGKYRSVIAWIFGDRADFEVGGAIPNEQYLPLMEKLQPGYAEQMVRLWGNRDGIEVKTI